MFLWNLDTPTHTLHTPLSGLYLLYLQTKVLIESGGLNVARHTCDTGEGEAPPPGRFQSDLFLLSSCLSKLCSSCLEPYSEVRNDDSSIIIMPRRSAQEWMRTSLRTPGILIFGMVLSPCGWILNLTATVAPNWRTLHSIPGIQSDAFLQQGIWDICRATSTDSRAACGLEDTTYFSHEIIPVAQGLMVASLVVTILGLIVAIPGVRCWKDSPNWTVAGLGGLLIFISGVFTIIPISWYTHFITTIPSVSPLTDVRVGYCIVLGFIGGIFEVLAGFVMFIGICRCCGGKNRGERRVEEVMEERYRQQKPEPRRFAAPSLDRARSNASSSVPYSKDSLDDDVSFPRAKSPAARSINTTVSSRPYDADL